MFSEDKTSLIIYLNIVMNIVTRDYFFMSTRHGVFSFHHKVHMERSFNAFFYVIIKLIAFIPTP